MNLELMIKILKAKGFDDKFIQDRMRTFVGLKLPMLEEVFKHLNTSDASSVPASTMTHPPQRQ